MFMNLFHPFLIKAKIIYTIINNQMFSNQIHSIIKISNETIILLFIMLNIQALCIEYDFGLKNNGISEVLDRVI